MTDVSLTIDGRQVTVKPGTSILDAARAVEVPIPTLCHHEKLAPYGGCRLCIVEVLAGDSARLVASCVYPVEPDMVVRTRSDQIDQIRKTLIELMMAHAPDAPQLEALGKQYGAQRDRFAKDTSFCIHCGLCVRYCAQIKKKNAVGFVDRGPKKEISFIPQIAAKECHDCKECFELCPTSYLQAAFVLTESLAFPKASQPQPK